jgi:hypothetical protein
MTMPTPFPDVQGHCPACGWTTLFLGDGGYPTCSRIDCPEPDAASKLLERDPRTSAHAVVDTLAREQLHDAIRTLARLDPKWWRGELDRMARYAGRTSFLGGH